MQNFNVLTIRGSKIINTTKFACYEIDQIEWRTAYCCIRNWFRSNKWRISLDPEGVQLQDGTKPKWDGTLAESLVIIDKLPSPSKVTLKKAGEIFDEVCGKRLEWGSWQHDGFFVMNVYANAGKKNIEKIIAG